MDEKVSTFKLSMMLDYILNSPDVQKIWKALDENTTLFILYIVYVLQTP